MSMTEFRKWIAFDKISPLDPERSDFRTALLCTSIANMFSKGNFKIKDFMPDFSGKQSTNDSKVNMKVQQESIKTILVSSYHYQLINGKSLVIRPREKQNMCLNLER